MALPSLETAKKLLASGSGVRARMLRIAKKLEALNEYHPEQALIVAADIVLHSLKSGLSSLTSSSIEAGAGS